MRNFHLSPSTRPVKLDSSNLVSKKKSNIVKIISPHNGDRLDFSNPGIAFHSTNKHLFLKTVLTVGAKLLFIHQD